MARRSKKQPNTTMIIVLAVAILMGGYILGDLLGWWAAETVETAEATTITVNVYDTYNNEEMNADYHEIYRYKVDMSNLTDSEIENLEYADYSYDTSFNSGGYWTPAADYKYCLKVNGSDIVETWVIDITIADVGVIDIYVANMTEDVAMACVSVDELATGLVNTTYDEWNINFQALDGAEGTGSATEKEGYKAYYDFEDDAWNTVVLKISFNSTAVISYVDLKTDVLHDTSVSGNDIYFEMKIEFTGLESVKIDFASAALNSTVGCAGASIGYGSAASFTAWDTYTVAA